MGRRLPPAPGCLLVAAPALTEATFVHTVLYVLEHDESGTAAVILNRPSRTPVGQVLPDWHDVVSGPSVVFSGGPVQPDGALCLGLLSEVGRATARGDATAATTIGATGGKLAVRPVVDAICTVDLDGAVDPVDRGDERACGSSPVTPAGRPASSTTNSPRARGSSAGPIAGRVRRDARAVAPRRAAPAAGAVEAALDLPARPVDCSNCTLC